jgi:U3 small nucleolar RNA-associated protein 14
LAFPLAVSLNAHLSSTLSSARILAGSSALKLDDLLAPLASSSALTALKKSTRVLTSTSNKTKTLSAPLPQRAQERLDREAAYEQTKEEVDKWSATMKRIKQVLIYPSQQDLCRY